VSQEELKKEYNVSMKKPKGKYNCIIVTVAHKEFLNINEEDLLSYIKDDTYIIDVKGIWNKKDFLKSKNYWCL
jgi:UDP-N-acetyl-D-galactosamine dehydrogenase